MLGDGTSRYSTGRPGRENAFAVAEPPTTPIRPGSAAAANATTATRRDTLRTFSKTDFTNPPQLSLTPNCRKYQGEVKHVLTGPRNQVVIPP